MTGDPPAPVPRAALQRRPQRRRGRGWWPVGLLVALAGCQAATAAPATPAARTSYSRQATPQVRPVACTQPLDTTAPDRTGGVPQRLAALLELLAGGRTPAEAMAQLYTKPIAALTAPEQEEALSVLAALDSCATVASEVSAEVPRLVRLIAFGAPNAPPLTVAPAPESAS